MTEPPNPLDVIDALIAAHDVVISVGGGAWYRHVEPELWKLRKARDAIAAQAAAYDRLRADNAKLREFACHKKGCAKLGRYGAECSCGFDRALAETEPRPSVVRRSEVPGDEPHDGRESHL